jgi:hypothetical protein
MQKWYSLLKQLVSEEKLNEEVGNADYNPVGWSRKSRFLERKGDMKVVEAMG